MKKNVIILTIVSALASFLGYLAALVFHPGASVIPSPNPERFPIISRFELLRDYGYFIGDEIPLTLIIETTGNVVLDLVNLPQPGEKHGVFEIRNRTLSSSTRSSQKKLYRVAFILQYFGPTPLTTQFDALEILYAVPQGQQDSLTYRSLFTQPVTINISRIGPYRSPKALAVKGPLSDSRLWLIWTAICTGIVCIAISGGGWGRIWWKQRQRKALQISKPPAAATILARLQREEDLFFPSAILSSFSAGERLAQTLREYLQMEGQVAAFSMTTNELACSLNGTPGAQAVLHLLKQCDALKYSPSTTSTLTAQDLWRQAITLFASLQKERAV